MAIVNGIHPPGINIAFADATYDVSGGGVAADFVRIDDPASSPTPPAMRSVVKWTTDRGRQYELDKTQAGTAVITIVDTTGVFDPTNDSGPFFPNVGPLKQACINVLNPADGSFYDIFTGFVESWDYTIDPTERLFTITINLTDGFELLSRAEVIPDSTGTSIYDAQSAHDRILAALEDDFGAAPVMPPSGAGWPSQWVNAFSGNVVMQRTVYNPQASILSVLQDAADAEFPNVANVFMDKYGNVAFRGRWARFNAEYYSVDPTVNAAPTPTPTQPIRFWGVGDGPASRALGLAPIHDIEWTLDLKNVINAVVCSPSNIVQGFINGQLVTDDVSIAAYGARVLSLPDILVASSVQSAAFPTSTWAALTAYSTGDFVTPTTSNRFAFKALNNGTSGGSEPVWPTPTQAGATVVDGSITWLAYPPSGDGVGDDVSDPANLGLTECEIFGQCYVDNYAQPVYMISKIVFQTIDPSSPLGPAWWKFITGVEIGDVVEVTTTNPGGGGFNKTAFFVEGIHNDVSIGGLDTPQWTMSLDLSPRVWYSVFNGVLYYSA